ncbi:MAG: hypothetical protein PHZ07_04230 [Patescibacteria group bacterium]|nr:hypothetical protein [Patescibacteria group bacterium]MDD4304764.1 hypothetical protein [Patescibacteria group bacterium]
MMSQDERTLSVPQEHEILLRLEKAGLTKSLAQEIINSPKNLLAEQIVDFMTMNEDRARDIMSHGNFISIHLMENWGFVFSDKDKKRLAKIPFSRQLLQECQSTHILLPVPCMSVLQMTEVVKNGKLSFEVADDIKSELSNPEEVANWHLIHKGCVKESTNLSLYEAFDNHQIFHGDDFPVSTQAVFCTIFVQFLMTHTSSFVGEIIRTSDSGNDFFLGEGVIFIYVKGVNDSKLSIIVDATYNSEKNGIMGIASERKPDLITRKKY